MISRCIFGRLLAGLLLLPIVLLLLLAVAGILVATGDQEGARWLGRLAALVGVAWGADLVALVAAMGLKLWTGAEHCEPVERDEIES